MRPALPHCCRPCLTVAGEAESAAGRAAELEAELAAQRQLAARLEEDLLAADSASASSAAAAGAGGDATGGGEAGGEAAGGEASMVGVLCSQRDRFRARAQVGRGCR